MKRFALKELENWSKRPNKKPLIIRGARQVGKTWLMKEFGKNNYKQTVYINFESSTILKTIFVNDFNIDWIISAIQIETGLKIIADNTLIIFDEIQEAEGAITSLKYFCENAPEYNIIAAGSLLGIALHNNISFPVGKVEFLDLYPLNFSEFLLAIDQQPMLELLVKQDWKLILVFKEKFKQFLKQYFYVGGMPEVVYNFSLNQDYTFARQLQCNILDAYEQDFSKHAPHEIVPRIRMLWNSVPSQLAKENKKFIYSAVKKGARAKNFELALSWLIDCGLTYRIARISKPSIPLKAYEDFNAFKLFIVDVGLLGAMGNIDARTLLKGNVIFQEFKGALTEQYVLQQFQNSNQLDIFYWSAEKSTAEVDFVVQSKNVVFAIEVKSEENLQAKSLKVFHQKYPNSIAIRASMSDFRKEEWLVNLPLYAINQLPQLSD